MQINFNLNETKVASSTNYLQAYTIYDNVEIESCELKSGTSQNGNEWKAIKINFKAPEGIYSEMLFIPTNLAEATQRKVFDMPNGGKREAPSQHEVFMISIASIAGAFNPEGFEKMKEMSSKFKSYDDITKAFMAVLNSDKKKATSMKLVGRVHEGRVYAALPKMVGISQNKQTGEWETWAARVFGQGLTFSSYELKARDEANAKNATKMESTVNPDETDVDLDLAALL